ncbi:LOW QUALITY PROTEIN: uncharacterized protein LOC143297868 [Babylonia areolata]|uniref:LOW QUALITY PROTEIN: uncharacterized protein LOC143297868 n=1 Tax=Babylonia areolata TaxID=304850 RepID=UPI003FD643D0
MEQLPDLESLSEEERNLILSVLQRDEEQRLGQQSRASELKQEIHQLRMKSVLRDGDDLSKMCARCKTPFGFFFNTGDVCPVCRFRVCKECRENRIDSQGWLCTLCFKENQLRWLSNQLPTERKEEEDEEGEGKEEGEEGRDTPPLSSSVDDNDRYSGRSFSPANSLSAGDRHSRDEGKQEEEEEEEEEEVKTNKEEEDTGGDSAYSTAGSVATSVHTDHNGTYDAESGQAADKRGDAISSDHPESRPVMGAVDSLEDVESISEPDLTNDDENAEPLATAMTTMGNDFTTDPTVCPASDHTIPSRDEEDEEENNDDMDSGKDSCDASFGSHGTDNYFSSENGFSDEITQENGSVPDRTPSPSPPPVEEEEEGQNTASEKMEVVVVPTLEEQIAEVQKMRTPENMSYTMQRYFQAGDDAGSDTLSIISERTEPEDSENKTEKDYAMYTGEDSDSDGTVHDEMDGHWSDDSDDVVDAGASTPRRLSVEDVDDIELRVLQQQHAGNDPQPASESDSESLRQIGQADEGGQVENEEKDVSQPVQIDEKHTESVQMDNEYSESIKMVEGNSEAAQLDKDDSESVQMDNTYSESAQMDNTYSESTQIDQEHTESVHASQLPRSISVEDTSIQTDPLIIPPQQDTVSDSETRQDLSKEKEICRNNSSQDTSTQTEEVMFVSKEEHDLHGSLVHRGTEMPTGLYRTFSEDWTQTEASHVAEGLQGSDLHELETNSAVSEISASDRDEVDSLVSHNVTEDTCDVAEGTRDVTKDTRDITEDTHHIMEDTHDVTDEDTHHIMEDTCDATGDTHDVTEETRDATEEDAHEVTEDTGESTDAAHHVTEEQENGKPVIVNSPDVCTHDTPGLGRSDSHTDSHTDNETAPSSQETLQRPLSVTTMDDADAPTAQDSAEGATAKLLRPKDTTAVDEAVLLDKYEVCLSVVDEPDNQNTAHKDGIEHAEETEDQDGENKQQVLPDLTHLSAEVSGRSEGEPAHAEGEARTPSPDYLSSPDLHQQRSSPGLQFADPDLPVGTPSSDYGESSGTSEVTNEHQTFSSEERIRSPLPEVNEVAYHKHWAFSLDDEFRKSSIDYIPEADVDLDDLVASSEVPLNAPEGPPGGHTLSEEAEEWEAGSEVASQRSRGQGSASGSTGAASLSSGGTLLAMVLLGAREAERQRTSSPNQSRRSGGGHEDDTDQSEESGAVSRSGRCNSLGNLHNEDDPQRSRLHYKSRAFTGSVDQLDRDDVDMTTVPRYRKKGKPLSRSRFSLAASRESLASVYSAAGEINYGRIPVTGEITFGLEYDQRLSVLRIHLKGCQDLAPVDAKHNRSDPYVKTYLLPDKTRSGKRKSKIKKRTLNPEYNETLSYAISPGELETRTLWVTVWHSDRFGRNDFLGEVTIPMDMEMFDGGDLSPQTFTLQSRISDGLSETPVQYKGELILSLMYVTADKALAAREGAPKKSKSRFRKSKHSAAAATQLLGEIHVLIKAARHLMAVRSSGTSDPFVKGYILPERSRSGKQKTPLIKNSLNPMWNHILVFEGVDEKELAERSVELTVWDHETLGTNEFLGGVRLNLGLGGVTKDGEEDQAAEWMDGRGEEAAVWRNMMDKPDTWVDATLPLRATMNMAPSKR